MLHLTPPRKLKTGHTLSTSKEFNMHEHLEYVCETSCFDNGSKVLGWAREEPEGELDEVSLNMYEHLEHVRDRRLDQRGTGLGKRGSRGEMDGASAPFAPTSHIHTHNQTM